jgi:bacillithiol synthase
MDAPSLRFLERYGLPLQALRAPDESALNALIEARLPHAARAALSDAAEAMRDRWNLLTTVLPQIDPTLEGAARSALGRLQFEIDTLQWKTVRAAKRRETDMRRQFTRAQQLAFPRGRPQERELSVVYFVNQYGSALIDRLVAELPAEMGNHWVVAI